MQARSLMEYRQAELRLEQLYTQIRMQVVNAQFALTNDRAQVQAALAARDYNQQSLDAEITKLHLGASTTANVLLQQRNLATAEDNLIAANAAYAKDRAGLYQTLASTLQHYGINLNEAATGHVKTTPVVPGVQPAPPGKEPLRRLPSLPRNSRSRRGPWQWYRTCKKRKARARVSEPGRYPELHRAPPGLFLARDR